MYPVTVASDVSLGGLQVTEMAVGLIISALTLVGVLVTIAIYNKNGQRIKCICIDITQYGSTVYIGMALVWPAL